VTRSREGQVLEAVVALVDSLLDDFDVVELLTRLTEDCAQLLDVAAAALLLADSQQQLHVMAATSDRIHDLEMFQLQRDEGPCLDCYLNGQPVSVADLRTEVDQWPAFAQAAEQAGFRSVHALPMRAAGTLLGTLGLFGTSAGELNSADLTVAQALAHVASVAIVSESGPTPVVVLPRLRSALTSRIAVDQAKGVVRARLDVPIDEAFRLLRRYAQVHDEHITVVARRMVSERAAREQILAGLTELLA